MSVESNAALAWVGVVVDLLLILLGALMISQGWWTDFAEVLVAICTFGLAVSIFHLWRGRRQSQMAE